MVQGPKQHQRDTWVGSLGFSLARDLALGRVIVAGLAEERRGRVGSLARAARPREGTASYEGERVEQGVLRGERSCP